MNFDWIKLWESQFSFTLLFPLSPGCGLLSSHLLWFFFFSNQFPIISKPLFGWLHKALDGLETFIANLLFRKDIFNSILLVQWLLVDWGVLALFHHHMHILLCTWLACWIWKLCWEKYWEMVSFASIIWYKKHKWIIESMLIIWDYFHLKCLIWKISLSTEWFFFKILFLYAYLPDA